MGLNNLHLVWKYTSLSSVIDNPSYHLDYMTTSANATLADVNDLVSHIQNASNAIPTGAAKSATAYLSQVISRASFSATVDAYDVTGSLSGTRMGSPIALYSWTPTGIAGTGASPEGCACTITLQAPYGTDVEFGPNTRPRSRDRGRIYFGPLSSAAYALEPVTGRTQLATAIQTDLCLWIKSIYSYTTAINSVPYTLSVWSRANASMKNLSQAWIDDRPDYVRLGADQAANRHYQTLP